MNLVRFLFLVLSLSVGNQSWASDVEPLKAPIKRKAHKKKRDHSVSKNKSAIKVSVEEHSEDEKETSKVVVVDPFELLDAPIPEGKDEADAEEYESHLAAAEKEEAEEPEEPPEPKHWTSTFLSYYGSSTGAQIGAIGATFAPMEPLEETGLRFLVQGVGGAYRYRNLQAYRSGNPNNMVNGWTRQMSAMLGYEWVQETWGLGVFLGVNWQDNTIGNAVDMNNKTIGSFWGESQGIEFHAQPDEQISVEWNGSYSTATSAFYTTLKLGYAVAEEVYVGPEAYALGNNFYDQARFGGFIRGLKLDILEFNASTGYEDRFRGQSKGVYGQLSASTEF